MWTKEKLEKAAEEWTDSKNPSLYDWDSEERTFKSFLAGCEYIINNTQRENE